MVTSEWMSLILFGCCSQPSSPSPPSPYSVGTQLSTKYGCLHPMTCVTLTCYAHYSSYGTNMWNKKTQKYTPSGFIQLDSYDCYLWHPLFFCKISIFLIKLIILYCIMWLTLICHAGVLYSLLYIVLHQAQCDRFLMSWLILFWLYNTDEKF